MLYAKPVARLVTELNRLPGVGPKTAQRLAFHLLNAPEEEARNLASAILEAREKVHYCGVCGDLTEEDLCRLCTDGNRDRSIICVVEAPPDLVALEKTHEFKGLYHVLHGALSPMGGIGPDQLNIASLLARLGDGTVREVVLATNPNVEGEATSLYLGRLLKPLGLKVTRLAHGLPVGGDLEYADELTLARAFQGRQTVE